MLYKILLRRQYFKSLIFFTFRCHSFHSILAYSDGKGLFTVVWKTFSGWQKVRYVKLLSDLSETYLQL